MAKAKQRLRWRPALHCKGLAVNVKELFDSLRGRAGAEWGGGGFTLKILGGQWRDWSTQRSPESFVKNSDNQ